MATKIQLEQQPGTTGGACLSAIMRRYVLLTVLPLLGATELCAQVLVQPSVIVSVREQKLMLLQNGAKVATYPVSTSKFGLGDSWGAMTTPTGILQVAQKIGDNAPAGAVFHNRRFTGEILQPNVPGRDPITTRIIWLRGLQAENAHAFSRCIYIHGTPEEKNLGRPASFGCVRMRAADVAALYAQLPVGAIIQITPDRLPNVKPAPKDMIVSSESILSADVKGASGPTERSAAEKSGTTPLPKASFNPAKKSDATAWVRNVRA